MDHGGEFWQNVNHWRREWQTTSVFLPWEPHAAATSKSLQSCPTLGDPINGSLPGSAVPGILQARTLECVAISFSNAWKWKVKVKSLSRVWLFATPWTAVYQAPLSMGFSRQECWKANRSLQFKSLYTLIHVEVWQKTTKFCKEIILQ